MKTKVLLISSSPHTEKSRTFSLAKDVLKGLSQEGADIETIHLHDFRVFFCKHCEQCHKNILHCPLSDDVHVILKKMLEADGIILASPNYINQVTASMKALFDRSTHFIHCKSLLGKYVAGVVSSGSGQDKEVLGYIEYYGHTCGAQYSGGVSCAAQSVGEKKEEAIKLGRKLVVDIQEKKSYPEQLELIAKGKQHFKRIIEARKKEWAGEYQYWQDKGWL
ncbi:MAG: flavodoxin family protein [Sedimentisphaerales bacterium]|jgi:multimeric flavodoxin WrbA